MISTGVYPTEVPSNTQGWETVQEEESAVVPDVERNNYIFSDGCGLISDELTDLIVSILRKKGRIRSTMRRNPSAFQIRFGGCKGIVVCYPDRPELPEPLAGKR